MESMNSYLCELFYNVMDKNLAGFLNIQKVRHVKKKLPKNRKNCKGKKVKENPVQSFSVQKRLPEGQEIAPFYECRTCLASSTTKTFQELTVSNHETIKKMTQRKIINICCIAGGIVSELVAMIKILSNESENFIHFSLKFLNASKTWDDYTSAVLKELQSYANEEFRMKISWDFQLVPDKKEQNKQEILESFHSADILLVTKFSHDLSDMNDKQLQQLLQVAFPQMKTDSLSIFIDNGTADFIKYTEKELSSLQSFQNIYKKINDYHILTINSIEDHHQRYRDHFGVELNSSYCYSSVSAWLKISKRRNSKLKGETSQKRNSQDSLKTSSSLSFNTKVKGKESKLQASQPKPQAVTQLKGKEGQQKAGRPTPHPEKRKEGQQKADRPTSHPEKRKEGQQKADRPTSHPEKRKEGQQKADRPTSQPEKRKEGQQKADRSTPHLEKEKEGPPKADQPKTQNQGWREVHYQERKRKKKTRKSFKLV